MLPRSAGLAVLFIAGLLAAPSDGGGLWAAASAQVRDFPRTIAAITVGQDHVSHVRSLYGAAAETTVADTQSLCYYVEQDQSYLVVSTFERESRVRSVSLTTFPDITPGCPDAKIKGTHLIATRGVALGDSTAKVAALLGPPKEIRKLRMGDRDVVQTDYPVAGGRATCMFDHDKLALIGVELD